MVGKISASGAYRESRLGGGVRLKGGGEYKEKAFMVESITKIPGKGLKRRNKRSKRMPTMI